MHAKPGFICNVLPLNVRPERRQAEDRGRKKRTQRRSAPTCNAYLIKEPPSAVPSNAIAEREPPISMNSMNATLQKMEEINSIALGRSAGNYLNGAGLPLLTPNNPALTHPKGIPIHQRQPQPHSQLPVTAPQPLSQFPATALWLLWHCPHHPLRIAAQRLRDSESRSN